MDCIAALTKTDGSIHAQREPETGIVRVTVRGSSEAFIELSPVEWHDFIWQASPHNK